MAQKLVLYARNVERWQPIGLVAACILVGPPNKDTIYYLSANNSPTPDFIVDLETGEDLTDSENMGYGWIQYIPDWIVDYVQDEQTIDQGLLALIHKRVEGTDCSTAFSDIHQLLWYILERYETLDIRNWKTFKQAPGLVL